MDIPSKPSNGLLGDLKTYVNDPLRFLEINSEQLGDIFKFRIAHRNLIFVNDPKYVEHILQVNNRNYKKSLAYRKLELLLGNGLFNTDGDFWRKQRRLAQPAFHREKIAGYADIMIVHTDDMISKLKNQNHIELSKEFTHLTLKIISEALLGINLQDQGSAIEEHLPGALKFMIRRITSAVNAPLWFPTETNKSFKTSRDVMDKLIRDLIRSKREKGSGNDLLSELMTAEDAETGEKMTDQQLRDEMLTFFLAGHETTAISLFWLTSLILTNSEVEKEFRTAIAEIPYDFKLQDISNTLYVDAVIKEAMRLIAPVWVISREAIDSDQLGEYDIKKGDSIIFSPYLIHRHQSYWDNPKEFDPNRFLDGKSLNHKFSYFPFGGGPRLCIGNNFALLEIKIAIIKLFQAFKFDSDDIKMPEYDCSLTLRPANELKVRLVKN
ncbi:MAG: cytochrome P450 [bacterium]|nr:cytochrome P450 [bacterium]